MEGLGVDFKYLLIQLANIGIFYFLFTKFLLKPILKMLDSRRAKIQEGLENAEKAKKELEGVEILKEEAQRTAKNEEKKALQQAKEEAEIQAAQIIAQAKEKAEKIVKDATEASGRFEEEISAKIEVKHLEIISQMLEKILGDKMEDNSVKIKYQKAMNEMHK